MRQVITTYLGKEVDEDRLIELFEKWADQSLPVEAFMALHRNARHDDSVIAEYARWVLCQQTRSTINVIDIEVAA